MKFPPVVSPASWLTAGEMYEQRLAGEDLHATMHVAIQHGASTRVIEVPLSITDCLVIAANASDAARRLLEAENRGRV